ncbi:MAG: hypothetical protein QXN55_00675 [Candidatus Nitrosotenuis sp.]
MTDEKKPSDIIKEDSLNIFADGKIDAQDVKTIFESRTVWVNILAFVVFFAQSKFGFVIDETTQAQILTLINIGLRYITKDPVRWK